MDQLLLSSAKVAVADPVFSDGDVAALSLTAAGRLRVTSDSVTTPVAASAYVKVSTASTNAAVVKATAGSLFEISVFNPTAAIIYVKLYNKGSGTVVGTDVPLVVFPVAVNAMVNLSFGPLGKRFTAGITIATTAGPLSTDVAAIAAGALISATYL